MERQLREKLLDGKFNSVSPIRSKMMRAVKGKGNKSTELKLCTSLVQEGISGWNLHEKLIGKPDIYFPMYNLAVFLDGCFWHGCPVCGHIPKTNNEYWKAKIKRNIDRDIEKSQILKDQGYLVIRFWEHELLNNLEGCIEIIKNTLEDSLYNLIYKYNDY